MASNEPDERLVFPGEGVYVGDTTVVGGAKMRQGRGVMFGLSGDLFEGEWQNDSMHGLGMHKGADGSVYEGSYVDHMRHGFGKLS